MEKTVNTQPTKPMGSTIKELLSIIKDGEIKDSILSLKSFQGMEFSKDKETQTPVIYLYGVKGSTEEVKEVSAPIPQKKNKPISESKVDSIIKDITGANLPSHLREANKKVSPVLKLSVPYSNLNSIFIEAVQKYLTANKLIVTSVRMDTDKNFIVMFSNKNVNNQFLANFIQEVMEYKDYISMDARNINVARALTNTEIKQIADLLNSKLPFIVEEMFLDEKVRQIFGEEFLSAYKISFSIDSFIKKTKNSLSESAIKSEALRLNEEIRNQNLKVAPPFEKWTSGDVKELPKQKKVSTLPVEFEVRVQVSEKTQEQKTSTQKSQNAKDTDLETLTQNAINSIKPNTSSVKALPVMESVLKSLGITTPLHLKEDSDIDLYKGIEPYKGIQAKQGNTELSNDLNWNQSSRNYQRLGGPRFDTSNAEDAKFRDVDTSVAKYAPNNSSTNPTPSGNNKSSKQQENTFLTVEKLKALRSQFVRYSQSKASAIRTRNKNSNLFNDLPVVFGNGKDKYIKVDQKGINGLFTIEAALGEQGTLTKIANTIYNHRDALMTHGDNSTVAL